jgi:WD40 repeat protein
MSALPPLQKRSQSLSRATGQIFLLHGSSLSGYVTASDPATGQVSRETHSHPDALRTTTQSIAIHENIIAFGTTEGRVSIVDVNNRRKLDGGWKAMRGLHDFVVTALFIPSSPFSVEVSGSTGGGVVSLISASGSGGIRLHDVATAETMATYRLPGTPILPMCMITYLVHDSESNLILAGACTGDVWALDTTKNAELKQVVGTKYIQSEWDIPQDVLVNPQTEMISLKVDVFFLSDLRNDSIFVIKGKSIKRFGVTNSSLTEFIASDAATFTCATIDPDSYEPAKPRIFAVGDNKGTVFVYNARAQPLSEDNSKVQPLYAISPAADIKVTALAINPLVFVTGSNDGTAKAYSTLNGGLLRTLCSPNSRRRRFRPPSPTDDPTQNPIITISLTPNLKSEVRGVVAFGLGHIGYWNFTRDGVGVVSHSRKRRKIRTSAKEIKDFVNNEIERDVEEGIENTNKRKFWEKLNGGIKEEEVAIQVAMMMSREEEERRPEFQNECAVEPDEDVLSVVDEKAWEPGRKISFGCTSGSTSPLVRSDGDQRLGDVVVFRKEVSRSKESRRFDEDLEFAIRLSLAEYESRETNALSE